MVALHIQAAGGPPTTDQTKRLREVYLETLAPIPERREEK
jgi:hypothetical protein